MRWIDEALTAAEQEHLLRRPTTLRYRSATECEIDGRPVIVFCGNDYLGLRFDRRLADAAAAAAASHGTGAGASRLVSGHTDEHERTEQALAELVRQPAALLTSSGFAANAGAIPALAGADDVVFSDALNHASIVDGCRLSRARVAVYPHADLDALKAQIERHRPFRRAWVITESIFSMDGDAAPLRVLRALCDANELGLYVDEAHALGLIGPEGAGLAAETGTAVEVLLGTLGKSLGAAGAFIAGTESLRLLLWNRCRSFVFSTGLPPPVAAAARTAAHLVRTDGSLAERLHSNIRLAREALARVGLPIGGDPRAPILPLVLGNEARALALSRALLEDGLFVQAIRPPTVPRGTARLRITLSAAHTPEQIEALAESLRRHA